MRGPLSPHLGLIVVLFDFKETLWWVRMSAPTGCSPRGLGGMGYPFKGLELSRWVRLGTMKGRAGQ
jgi:hypothetical protein